KPGVGRGRVVIQDGMSERGCGVRLRLILTSGAPPERRGRRTRPRRGAAHGCGAFSAEAGCLLGKSRRLRGPGAKHRARRPGGAFFAPGFFAQAKKGGSRRHGAKALDLDIGGTGTAGGSRPALRGCYRRRRKARAARCARTLIRPPGTFSREREKGWRCAGRAGGGCFLCARFLCTSKERWLAPSRRESP